MTNVDFIFDFASPNAYLAHKLLPGIAQRTGATFDYVPCLLGGIFKATGNQPPMVAFQNVPAKIAYEMLEVERFIAKHSIPFTMNPDFPINTLILMRGAIAAEQDGQLAKYVEAGMHHMWVEPKKMDDPMIYVAAMTESGFDGLALLERSQDPDIKQQLASNTATAVERQAFGIPTFFVNGEIFFGKDRLQQVEEEISRT